MANPILDFVGRSLRGQSATEVMVVLAVVLVVGIVAVSLIGAGSEGHAKSVSDSRSAILWGSLTPISIGESKASVEDGLELVFKNKGAYPARLTSIISEGGSVPVDSGWVQPEGTYILEISNPAFLHSLSPTTDCISSQAFTIPGFGITYEQAIGAGGETALLTKTASQGIPLEIKCIVSGSSQVCTPSCERWQHCCKSDGICKVDYEYCGTRQVCLNGGKLCDEGYFCNGDGSCQLADACGGSCDYETEQCCAAAGNRCILKEMTCDACSGSCNPETEQCCEAAGNACIQKDRTCDICGGCKPETEQCCEAAGNRCIKEDANCDVCGGKCNPETEQCCAELGQCRPFGYSCVDDTCGGSCDYGVEQCCEAAGDICIQKELTCDVCGGCASDEFCCTDIHVCRPIGGNCH